MLVLEAGAEAFVVEFGNAISTELSARATAFAALLEREPFAGFREAVPTFRSALVLHDPEADPEASRRHAAELARRAGREAEAPGRRLDLPCVYDGEDLAFVAAAAEVPEDELVRMHAGRDYRVFLIGFTPGFPYLGMADPRLDLPRRRAPRVRVPAGAVALARAQTGVYPWVSPGGWHLIGRTDPSLLFDVAKTPPSACLPGDRVRFLPVSRLPDRAAERSRPSGVGAPTVEVEWGGLLTTVQDLGRPGFRRYGVPVSGAADPVALAWANRAVGNPDGAAGIEATLSGPVLRFRRDALAALGGADHGAVLEQPGGARWRVPVGTSFLAPEGSVLRFEGPPAGARCYLALAGGIEAPPVLGSRSTYLTAGFGGLEGRALRDGDLLATGPAAPEAREGRYVPGARRSPGPGALRLRLSLGPQEDCFAGECLRTLTEQRFTVSNDSNRMGVRLDGPCLEHRPGRAEIVSDANPPGTVQVPPSGQPVVMGADQGTTGGYPKLGSVVAPDLARLAQLLSGAAVRFEIVSPAVAREITLAERP